MAPQISDTPIVPVGALVSGRQDTANALAQPVKRIDSIPDQIGPVGGLPVSGNLSDDGSADSYARFNTLVAPLGSPSHIIPRNHDARDPMRNAFAGCLPASGVLNWGRKTGDTPLVGLDALVEGHRPGTLSSDGLTYLQDALSEVVGVPALFALHHPHLACGIGFIDDIELTNQNALRGVLADYSGALRIVCGHIHHMMVCDVVGYVAISAPSPCNTFVCVHRPDAPVGYMTQEDGCPLHRRDLRFQTIRPGPVAGSGPFPF